VFAFGGIAFHVGVLLYWTTSNIWTMGQQFYVIRNNPAPETRPEKAKQERDAKKAAAGVGRAPTMDQRGTTARDRRTAGRPRVDRRRKSPPEVRAAWRRQRPRPRQPPHRASSPRRCRGASDDPPGT
jgi:YidC/Oxa1 family membrane protein insertase